MKNKKWVISAALLLSLLFTLSGCNVVQNVLTKSLSSGSSSASSDLSVSSSSIVSSDSVSSSVTSSKLTAGMQLIDTDKYSLEIPDTWSKTEVSGYDTFLPQDANMTTGASNININVAVPEAVLSFKAWKLALPTVIEKEVKSYFPNASNFKYSDMKSAGRDVFVANYQVTDTMSQTQYYLIGDKAVAAITVTDIGDGDKLGLQDIAKHMLDTLVIK